MAEHLDRFRAEVRSWLASVERPVGLRDYGATPSAADVEAGRAWQAQLAAEGWACLAWPTEHGGRGASFAEQAIFAEETARAGVPRQLNIVGPDLAGPVLMAYGTRAQSAFLPRIRDGRDLWCQLFSEPEAGSDLAAVRTAARRKGDRWIIDGQKVWSSAANTADMGLLLARTGDGRYDLTMFAVSMHNLGIEVRPLRQLDGESKFNEVFLDGLEVGSDDVLGAVGEGWKLALSTLGSERLALGSHAVALAALLDETIAARGGLGDAVTRDRAAALWSRIWLLRTTWMRAAAGDASLTSPAFSILKLAASELHRDVTRFASTLGPSLVAGDEHAPFAQRLLAAPGQTIAGGTSEIQRNILAERVLGLPR